MLLGSITTTQEMHSKLINILIFSFVGLNFLNKLMSMRNKLLIGCDKALFLYGGIIIVLGILADEAKSNIILALGLVITCVVSLVVKADLLIPLVFLLIAPNRLLTLGPISAPTIVMIVGVMREGFRIRKTLFMQSMILIIYSVATMFIGKPVLFDSLKTIVVLIFLEEFSKTLEIQKQFSLCVKSAVFGCGLSFVLALASDFEAIKESNRFALTENGQNVFGITCAVLIVSLIVDILDTSNDKKCGVANKNISAFLLVIMGILTGSRSFLLAVAVGVIIVIAVEIKKIDVRNVVRLMLLGIALVIVLAFLYAQNDLIRNYVNSFVYRMEKLQRTDISNGRFELWMQYITVLIEEPQYLWFGNLNPIDFGIDLVAHNMILEQIADFGAIGSAIIFIMYLSAFQRIACDANCVINYGRLAAPLAALLSASMVSHSLLGVPQTMMLYMCFIGALRKRGYQIQ